MKNFVCKIGKTNGDVSLKTILVFPWCRLQTCYIEKDTAPKEDPDIFCNLKAE